MATRSNKDIQTLPDRWGNAVFDAWFKEEGLHEKDKTPLTKLSFIGRRAMGALEFYPVLDSGFYDDEQVRIDRLYEQAQMIEQQLAGKSIPAGEPLTRRFDRKDGEKRFMQTLAAVDPDAHSYEDMFRTCRELEIPKPEIDELFKRTRIQCIHQ